MDALGCVLLPSCCVLCGSHLPHFSSIPICDACWSEFPAQTGARCTCCGDALEVPVQVQAGSAFCRACRLASPPFVRAVACGPYEGRMRAAIHAFKYDRLHAAARPLGRMLAESISQFAKDTPDGMLVVPVPLHRSKERQRGFNQARSLAEHALAALRNTHPEWPLTLAPKALVRHRSTESQAGLTPHQRRMNVRGAFSVSDSSAVVGKDVLVVDDIFTTGATARSVSRALVRAGAASVRVATLARARMINTATRSFNSHDDDDSMIQAISGSAVPENLLSESIHSLPEQRSL
jgi:ComF family protein